MDIQQLQDLALAQEQIIQKLVNAGKGMLDHYNNGTTDDSDSNRPCRRMIAAIENSRKLKGEEVSQLDIDGWIKWEGGPCPFAPGICVEVKFRNGRTYSKMQAVHWNWEDATTEYSIVAYRVIEEN